VYHPDTFADKLGGDGSAATATATSLHAPFQVITSSCCNRNLRVLYLLAWKTS
jgi:phosphotransferase system IIA component